MCVTIPSLNCLLTSFAPSCTRFFLPSSSTTATGSPWKPLRDIRRGWEMERERGTVRDTEREKGRHERLGCYHMAPKHPHPPLSLMLNPQPRSTAPNTHCPPYTHLCLPRTLAPIFLLSIPLLSRQAARMAGMETFTDGSTGKFSHPQNNKTRTRVGMAQTCILHT